jgi:hypothetical protein
MPWFTKTEKPVESVIDSTPLERYEQNRSELRVLDKELGDIGANKDPRVAFLYRDGNWSMQTRVNAMTMDPSLQQLEWSHAEILLEASDQFERGRSPKKRMWLGELLRRRMC